MKNAESVFPVTIGNSPCYWQIDNQIKTILKKEGVIVLPISKAWKELNWTRKYLIKEPKKQGYFIWVKKTTNIPIMTCVSVSSKAVSQHLENLIVIDKGVSAKMLSFCNSLKQDLGAKHLSFARVVLKDNAELFIDHNHTWGKNDFVSLDFNVLLSKGAKIFYKYTSLSVPRVLKTNSSFFLKSCSSVHFEANILAENGNVDINDSVFINGKDAKGITRLALVAGKNGKIYSKNRIVANKQGIGHLDCSGLLLSDTSMIDLIPELLNKDKKAMLTHEASVGRISDDVLNYLRSRGLTEKQAINLVVSGFLKKQDLKSPKYFSFNDKM